MGEGWESEPLGGAPVGTEGACSPLAGLMPWAPRVSIGSGATSPTPPSVLNQCDGPILSKARKQFEKVFWKGRSPGNLPEAQMDFPMLRQAHQ